MKWIAIAATVENEVVIAHDDITILEQIAEQDFQIIVKVYGVTDEEYLALKSNRYDYRIKFNNLRSTYLDPISRSETTKRYSLIYNARINQLQAAKGRFEHALNKHRTVLSQQMWVYEAKASEASDILLDPKSPYRKDGFVFDYAQELDIDIDTAATLVQQKYAGWYDYMRKIERLRIRHFNRIKRATTEEDFKNASAALDKDFFINMLL
jgi:hypothetical protein